jgi:hypothetical protein
MGEHEHLESYKYSSTSHSSAKVLQNNKQFLLCGRTVIVLCIIVIAVDTFCHLPDLQHVIFSHASNDPFLATVPCQFLYLGCVTSMDEQQLRRPVICIFLRLLISNSVLQKTGRTGKKGTWSAKRPKC